MASQDLIGRVVSYLIPATYFMDVVRGSYLKGGGAERYAPSLAALVACAVAVYAVADVRAGWRGSSCPGWGAATALPGSSMPSTSASGTRYQHVAS